MKETEYLKSPDVKEIIELLICQSEKRIEATTSKWFQSLNLHLAGCSAPTRLCGKAHRLPPQQTKIFSSGFHCHSLVLAVSLGLEVHTPPKAGRN